MSASTTSADAKRALLEKYLRKAAASPAAAAPAAPTIPPRPADRPIPLSYGQQQLWFMAQMLGGVPAYNECVTLHLPGDLDVAVLERSLVEILRRHEAWRTTFVLNDGEPAQIVHPAPETVSLPSVDLAHQPAAERAAEAQRLASAEAARPFDLATGPLWRGLLVRHGEHDHRLILTIHHIIFDGVSTFQVFLPEIDAIYRALLAGEPIPLPAPPIQYGDFAAWQRADERRAESASRLPYWRERLAERSAVIELPTDRPRPPVRTFRGAMRSFSLSAALTTELRALGSREGASLYMVFLAALATLLHRHTGQTDLPIATASSGRDRPEVQGLLGLFINTLVLRTDLGGDPTFREVLRRVRETTIAAAANEVPFEQLVRELRPERDASRNPFFDVLITLEPAMPILASGWKLTTLEVSNGASKFDLSLKLDDMPHGMVGHFEYNTDLFDEATILRLIAQFETLLAGIAADPNQPIAALPLLPEAQVAQVRAWNATVAPLPATTLHGLVAEQAARTPDATALDHNGQMLTYAELDARANGLARHLGTLGVGRGTLVALATDRSFAMLVGMLGILKAGGAYVPLDTSYPVDRLAFMLEDTAAAALLTQRPLLDRLPPTAARTILLDDDWPTIASASAAPLAGDASPDDLAYVIYTSGSTGKPKGVPIPHRAVVNFLLAMRDRPGIAATDTLLAVTTLSFDIAVLELWLPLIVGAKAVIGDRAIAVDGPRLAALVRDSGATIVQATPATWRILLAAGWQGDPRLKLLCGGEALARSLADQLLDRCGELWNMYGPTETTVWSSASRVGPGEGIVPVGGPIANTTFRVIDERRQEVPVGVFGELAIGGVGLALGYLNRPELTADRFVADPFSDDPSARLYRTGDRVRWRADGTLEFSGRLDFQVKVRGYRIELGEIEVALLRQPAVREAIVIARDDTGETRLVAYLTPREGHDLAALDLRPALRAQLPDFMIPSAFVVLERIPLGPSGKVDRRALPAPTESREVAAAQFVGPRDPLELRLTRIWEEVLQVQPIGVTDNFFDLGGHSLIAVRLFARIADQFGQDLPLATLFQAPTIAALADLLRQDGQTVSWSSLVPLQPLGTRPPFFCIHPIGGNVLTFHDLARHLGPEQPVYGLQAQGLDGRAAPFTRVEEMAAHYVTELRRLQPIGPYYVGGQCFGGMVALEVAQQLQAQGETVALLAMFDSYAPNYTKHLSRRANARLGARWLRQRAAIHLDELRAKRWQETPGYLARRARTVALRARNRVWQGAYRLYERLGQPLPERLQNVRQACLLAERAYVPHLYHGRPLLFVVEDRQQVVDPDPQFGWGDLATDGIAVYETPGNHRSMWHEPQVQTLATILLRCLTDAQAQHTIAPVPTEGATATREALVTLMD